MAEAAVLASGNGSNFEALVRFLSTTEHRICCLICDRKDSYALERARRLSIPAYYIPGWGKNREAAETEALTILQGYKPRLVVLAGFMRVLTPLFLDAWPDRVVNIHPSLLPKYPGTRGIQDSFASGDREVGITIHLVDSGVDTGPVLLQEKIIRHPDESLTELEERIHQLEHQWYPRVIRRLLEDGKQGQAVD